MLTHVGLSARNERSGVTSPVHALAELGIYATHFPFPVRHTSQHSPFHFSFVRRLSLLVSSVPQNSRKWYIYGWRGVTLPRASRKFSLPHFLPSNFERTYGWRKAFRKIKIKGRPGVSLQHHLLLAVSQTRDFPLALHRLSLPCPTEKTPNTYSGSWIG